MARILDEAVLRGVRPAPHLSGLMAAAKVADCAEPVLTLLGDLQETAAPLDALFQSERAHPFEEFVRAHWSLMAALTADDEGQPLIAARDAGEALASYVADLLANEDTNIDCLAFNYPSVFTAFMAGRTVRPKGPSHPAPANSGAAGSRLQSADVVILGGLNEQVWPVLPQADPWLSRPMRTALGLAAPERRIGLMAHDFAQGTARGRVILTRALKSDGTPTIASRWLQRVQAVTGRLGIEDALDPAENEDYRLLARQIDAAEQCAPGRPEPRPPLALRPRQLSVTQVETWVRDPYAIYARHILKLRALDIIDAAPDAADRGMLIHAILADFLREPMTTDPTGDLARLIEIGERAFARFADRPEVAAVWWPRFLRIADAFVGLEGARLAEVSAQHLEVSGKIAIAAPGGDFTLTARADRLDLLADAGVRIIDYKTGDPPTAKTVVSGLNPQMTLEGAILLEGGFEALGKADLAGFEYIRLSGATPPLEQKPIAKIDHKPLDPVDASLDAKEALARLIAAFDNPDQPYYPHVAAKTFRFAGDYDHLARVLEWSTGTGDDE